METTVLTPSRSEVDTDSLIEKFRVELTNAVEEDKNNERKLTITPVSVDDSEREVDKKLVDLENMIKRLQNELYQMFLNADKEVSEYFPLDNKECNKSSKEACKLKIQEEKENENIEEHEDNKKEHENENEQKTDEPAKYGDTYPLLLRDMLLPITNGRKSLSDAAVDILKCKSEDSTKVTEEKEPTTPEQIIEVKDDPTDYWEVLSEYAPRDGLEELVSELQAQIAAKLKALDDEDP